MIISGQESCHQISVKRILLKSKETDTLAWNIIKPDQKHLNSRYHHFLKIYVLVCAIVVIVF